VEPLLTLLALVAVVVAGIVVSQQRAARASARRRAQLDDFFTTLKTAPVTATSATTSSGGSTTTAMTPSGGSDPAVTPSTDLPTFADVGGMDDVKAALTESVGLVRSHRDRAAGYGIAFNGILLHGPPGTGKSYLARAIAGEFGMSLLHVSTGDLVEGIVGASARNVQRVFETARAHRPCVLFLDEFDSLAQRREAAGHVEERRTVNQLLVSLESVQDDPDLLVVAATNDLDHLDPAAIRPGRFDRHVRVDRPDLAARRAILAVQLATRPAQDAIDLDDLARRTAGRTAAELTRIVEEAALAAFRDAAATGEDVRITTRHLDAALAAAGGQDRPTVEAWSWDDLVLPADVLAELQQIEALVSSPELVDRLGVEPPRGVLLTGPPGTGKTTIARVLAAQARCSFYPVSAADVTSHWHGESERSIQRLFARARDHRPSIVFIDEIDALGAVRGRSGGEHADRQLTQLLTEIDGLAGATGVFVLAATNRPDVLDPALVRGGRISRRIEIPLPDEHGRLRLLQHFTRRMPTVGVDLGKVAAATPGMAGADLAALCQQAGVHALVRVRREAASDAAVEILPEDFARAILEHRAADPAGQ
jgi:transitional endoplasmic reticulum ATPase